MEDAIVAQVEWYLGRPNLLSDAYLKDRMDDDLWVDLSVILSFPKMLRLGVRDKARVAALLHARSTIVEVDLPTARIRPAWASRSTLVLHDVPPAARLDDLYALLSVPAPAPPRPDNHDLPAHNPPVHIPGLITVQPAADGVWLAVFDSPSGAHAALPHVLDSAINGAKLRPEVHVENALRPRPSQHHHHQHDSPAYPPPPPQPPSPALQPPPQVPARPVYVASRPLPAAPQEAAGAAAAAVAPPPQPPAPNAALPPVSAAMGYAPMLGPMGMPVPVMHHPPDAMHPQYAYAPPAGYIPHGYAPHNVGVPRQFMGPRGMAGAPANYMMAYPQGAHPFDPAAIGVAPQGHGVQPVQPPIDGAGAPGTPVVAAPGAPEGARGGEMLQAQAMAAAPGATGAAVRGDNAGAVQDGREVAGVEYAQDKVAPYPAMASSEQVQMPMVGAQGMDPAQMMGMQMREVAGKAPMDAHYMHRGAVIGDPNPAGLAPGMAGGGYVPYPRGAGRGQHQHQGSLHRGDRNGQRNSGEGGRGAPRGSGGNAIDATGRSQPNRKGKKGNRNNNGRHAHGHGDRHGDGRSDGKADGSGSPNNRDDRRPRDDKPKPEPNLNSMYFPPLPMANDSPPARTGQPLVTASRSRDWKDIKAGVSSDGKQGPADAKVVAPDTTAPSVDAPDVKAESPDATSLDTTTSAVTEAKDSVMEAAPGEMENNKDTVVVSAEYVEEVGTDASNASSDSKAVERSTSPGSSNGSTMSYAAILRSKKPTPARPAIPVQRGIPDSSTKSGGTNSSGDSSGGTSGQLGKDRNPRRRKSNNIRNSQNGESSRDNDGGAAGSNGADKLVSQVAGSSVYNVTARDPENVKSKVAPEASRAHSVWANKPKSLFQAAAAVPAARPTTAMSTAEVRKALSPVLSLEDEGGRDKADGENRTLDVNGQAESASIETQGTAITDASTNGDELPDVNQLSLAKTASPTPDRADGDTAKFSKGDQVGVNGNQSTPKGAWALGGPKPWPKNNGNGVMERSSGISDS